MTTPAGKWSSVDSTIQSRVKAIAVMGVVVCTLAGLVAGAGTVEIVDYTSGVAPAAGQSGAADPASQGWTLTNAAGNQYADGYDSGDGGWRTVDATSSGPANYSITLDTAKQTSLTDAPGWVISWTLALDKDALGSAGATSSNYYAAPNNGRQNNIVTLIDLAADSLGFAITHKVNGSNILLLEDTSGGSGSYNTGVDITSFPNFISLSLSYDQDSDTATLDYGAGTATLSPGSPLVGGRNAVFFGASDTAGQGSAVWNSFNLTTIPEPSTFLLGLGGTFVFLVRRKNVLLP